MTAVSKNYYQLYLNAVMELAQTIVVKSDDTATALNTYVTTELLGDVDETDPTTWKYYLNLSGQYHPTDTVMTVISMDTLETIDFTPANLLIHSATARGYVYGTRSYLELVSRYPDQEMLILGILYPVDITAAIAARDGLILGYPPGLVEVNEYSFVAQLQAYIDGFKLRWVNSTFSLSDNLYPAAVLGMMYTFMVPAILSIREGMCRTNEAHSFHVRQYLASNGNLGDYVDYMTTEQSLWFYRNINYVLRHAGMQSTFDTLVEHIMTDRALSIAEYTMVHDLTDMPGTLTPTVTLKRTPLNLGANVDAKASITLTDMLNKEQDLARDNATYQDDYLASGTELMTNSLSNSLKTKVVESSMIDYADSAPITLSAVLLNHWLWLSNKGVYSTYITVVNPVTVEYISLTAQDAFCFSIFCYAKSIGVTLTTIPPLLAKRVQRIPTPSAAELMTVVDPLLVDISIAQTALSWQPVIPTTLVSTEAFYKFGVQIFQATTYQRNLMAFQEHYERQAEVKNMIELIYCDAYCTVAEEGTLFADWMAERNIHDDNWTTTQYDQVYQNLVSVATGADLTTTTSLAQLQKAMVAMFAQLSSYSVQFLTEINSSNIRMSDMPYVRFGDRTVAAASDYSQADINVDVIEINTSVEQTLTFDLDDLETLSVDTQATAKEYWELDGKLTMDPIGLTFGEVVEAVNLRFRPHTPLVPNAAGITPVVGLEYYLGLTTAQQAQLKDVYGSEYFPMVEQIVARVLSTRYLSGLVWHQPLTPLTTLLSTPNLKGLIFQQQVEALSSLFITNLHGLIWSQPTMDIGAAILRTTLNGLTWSPNVVALSAAIVQVRANGLIYSPPPVDLGTLLAHNRSNGLEFLIADGQPLSSAMVRKDSNTLFYTPGTVKLSNTILRTSYAGALLHRTITPLSLTVLYTKASALMYAQTVTQALHFPQLRDDGIIWVQRGGTAQPASSS